MWRVGRWRLLALGVLLLAMFPAQLAGTRGVAASSGCTPVWTDPSGDTYSYLPFKGAPAYVGFYQPQLDLTSGTVWQWGDVLVFREHVANLQTNLPPGRGAESWDQQWFIGNGVLQTEALYTPTATQLYDPTSTYFWFSWTPQGSPTAWWEGGGDMVRARRVRGVHHSSVVRQLTGGGHPDPPHQCEHVRIHQRDDAGRGLRLECHAASAGQRPNPRVGRR